MSACAVERLTVDELLDGVFLDESTAKVEKNGPRATVQPSSSQGDLLLPAFLSSLI